MCRVPVVLFVLRCNFLRSFCCVYSAPIASFLQASKMDGLGVKLCVFIFISLDMMILAKGKIESQLSTLVKEHCTILFRFMYPFALLFRINLQSFENTLGFYYHRVAVRPCW